MKPKFGCLLSGSLRQGGVSWENIRLGVHEGAPEGCNVLDFVTLM